MPPVIPAMFLMFAYLGPGHYLSSEEPFYSEGECTSMIQKLRDMDRNSGKPPKIQYAICIPFGGPQPEEPPMVGPVPPGGMLSPYPVK